MQTTAAIFSTSRHRHFIRLGAAGILLSLNIMIGFFLGRASAPVPAPRVIVAPNGCSMAFGDGAGGIRTRHVPETMIGRRHDR